MAQSAIPCHVSQVHADFLVEQGTLLMLTILRTVLDSVTLKLLRVLFFRNHFAHTAHVNGELSLHALVMREL